MVRPLRYFPQKVRYLIDFGQETVDRLTSFLPNGQGHFPLGDFDWHASATGNGDPGELIYCEPDGLTKTRSRSTSLRWDPMREGRWLSVEERADPKGWLTERRSDMEKP
jgi:hypothetical protein